MGEMKKISNRDEASRNEAIIRLRELGLTFEQIAYVYRISRQRVWQIIQKERKQEAVKCFRSGRKD